MLRKLYNALWGYRGKVFHIYYSMYNQNKALHERFNLIERRMNELSAMIDSLKCYKSKPKKRGRPRVKK